MKIRELSYKEWDVKRHGLIEEVVDDDDEISWRVTVWDEDREPFITRHFSTRAAAHHFLDRVRKNRP
jgi:hypothetical protein